MSLSGGIGGKEPVSTVPGLMVHSPGWVQKYWPAILLGAVLILSRPGQAHKERGFLIFKDQAGVFKRGPVVVGDEYSLRLDLTCPVGCKPAALFHTHSFDPYPSSADLDEAARLNLPVLIAQGGEVRAYQAKAEEELVRFALSESAHCLE